MKSTVSPSPELAVKIGKKLRALTATHKPMNQRDMAAAIDIPTMVWNRAVNGKSTPAADAIIKIAKYFGITTDELLGVAPTAKPRKKITS